MEVKDVFGIEPIGKALEVAVTKSFEGIEGFLKLVCAPALEEVGLLVKDQVRYWRLKNVLSIFEKAKGKMEFNDDTLQLKANPRVGLSIIENGSLNDDSEMQNLWAGLFVSSCTTDGQDDENIIFVDLLKQLTKVQARILKHSCETARKIVFNNGLLYGDYFEMGFEELTVVAGCNDLHRLDRELDHLRSLELIGSTQGFDPDDESLIAKVTPSTLALNLYTKCQGYNGDPIKYWTSNIITEDVLRAEIITHQK